MSATEKTATAADCLAAFEAALSRADLDAAMALLSDDVVFFYSNGSAHFGKSAVRAAIKANFDSIKDDTYTTHAHICVPQSDLAAACTYPFDWPATMHGTPLS